jgi:hypothetical protein
VVGHEAARPGRAHLADALDVAAVVGSGAMRSRQSSPIRKARSASMAGRRVSFSLMNGAAIGSSRMVSAAASSAS